MISPLPSSITLSFDEADSELWQDLQRIEPDLRSTFIKEVLRMMLKNYCLVEKFLLQDEMIKIPTLNQNTGSSELREVNDSCRIEELPQEDIQEDPQEDSFSLEALFTEGPVSGISENKPKSLGYQHLMKNIIGLEDDEEVLKVFQDLSKHRLK
ncbi:hypothetical protein Desaci_0297 [Desulfosporosinus acidiphilus SJ4]|uniref:Uncharacterized protein n=1 Tax=Desulfosporosinus acidiphilus (strain DSM 22704 / JCM 16185 / SJ4) TaxID=646529 RepID=I4D0P5_DESAJ|nr:hypothetical protein [Desulfosporosinus acidiphilus]AFM39369.1 hypothetical protein Desaci_0297 [Desulfosporosinus acidiphilus SJ4]